MTAMGRRWWHYGRTALQIDVDAARIVLRRVLQPELATHLLDARLELLDVVDAVVSLADDTVLAFVRPASPRTIQDLRQGGGGGICKKG